MKKIIIICLILTGMTNIAIAKTLHIKDMTGRSVIVPFDPAKIICIGPGALRLIVYLNAQDKLAGVEDMEKLNPGGRPYWIANRHLAKLPRIGPGGPNSINKKPDLEAVLNVHPDLIFMTQADAQTVSKTQKQLGIPIVALSYGEFATFDERIYDSLKLAGKILNRDKRAEAIIGFIETAREELWEKTKGIVESEKPDVFVGGIGFRGACGIESTENNYIPIKWVNAKNIAENITASTGSHVFMDKEKLLAMNPGSIFIDGGGLKLVEEDMLKKPESYNALKAFQQKRVYSLLPFNFYATNVETALADAYAIAKVLYPKAFADIDPEKKADEIYAFMVGKPVYADMKKDHGKIGAEYDMKLLYSSSSPGN
ncbi:MAG: iron ABC transporter substrate-binding protein [Proteobacteria bacterium]|nr:iron ABC transporter substrate-binding protein [Pseudomonadota bacterium]